jgi:endo-1,4-beta-xylanase
MHLSTVAPVVLAALAVAKPCPDEKVKGLDYYAKKAGLKYFGSATDTPGQRERAGLDAAYAQYDKIMWGGEFGSTTPTNGQKVIPLFVFDQVHD